MKKSKMIALLMAAAMTTAALTGCTDSTANKNENTAAPQQTATEQGSCRFC